MILLTRFDLLKSNCFMIKQITLKRSVSIFIKFVPYELLLQNTEYVYATYACTWSYSYVRPFEIFCTYTYLTYCLSKYAEQEANNITLARTVLLLVYFSAAVFAPLIVIYFATLKILICQTILKSTEQFKICSAFFTTFLLRGTMPESVLFIFIISLLTFFVLFYSFAIANNKKQIIDSQLIMIKNLSKNQNKT